MSKEFQFIHEVSPGTTGWTVKVVVAEKFSPRIAQKSPTKYQILILVDSELSSKLSVPTDEKDFTEIKSIQGLKTVIGLGNQAVCLGSGCRATKMIAKNEMEFGEVKFHGSHMHSTIT
ncbi:Uncharacterized protein Fot_57179 [Forsythia ovata]|uniref:Uncharacterized protein n=1 Tax=Forsythia ovata TaxID=205694 RepID=A0ABD1NWD2_9LAMI